VCRLSSRWYGTVATLHNWPVFSLAYRFCQPLASLRGTMFEILAHLGGAITDFVGGLLMYSDHSLTFSIQDMRNEHFGLALQETSRVRPAETRQGAGTANANRNSRDRGSVRRINISPRAAPASDEQIDASSSSRVHATSATGSRRGRGAQCSSWLMRVQAQAPVSSADVTRPCSRRLSSWYDLGAAC
jgi:hypothetical protein